MVSGPAAGSSHAQRQPRQFLTSVPSGEDDSAALRACLLGAMLHSLLAMRGRCSLFINI